MADLSRIVKCMFCGRLYRFYAMSEADQSGCPRCVAKRHAEADETMAGTYTEKPPRRGRE